MEKFISKLSTGEQIDLGRMSVVQLQKLLYDEGVLFRDKTLSLPPFSKARKDFQSEIRVFIEAIVDELSRKRGYKLGSQGASIKTVKLLKRLLKKNLCSGGAFFEAGVGRGYAIEQLLSSSEFEGVSIIGCDFHLSSKLLKLAQEKTNLCLLKGDVKDCISKLPDDSIDFFYADNVIEHFIPDEVDAIFTEIAKKLKPSAVVFLIIPNRYSGHNVSYFYSSFTSQDPNHYMEMSFNETTELMAKYNVVHSEVCALIPKTNIIFSVESPILLKIKLRFEAFARKIPIRFLRRFLFVALAYNIYVLRKAQKAS